MNCPAGFFFSAKTNRCEAFGTGAVSPDAVQRYTVAGGRLYFIFLLGLGLGAGWQAWRSRR